MTEIELLGKMAEHSPWAVVVIVALGQFLSYLRWVEKSRQAIEEKRADAEKEKNAYSLSVLDRASRAMGAFALRTGLNGEERSP